MEFRVLGPLEMVRDGQAVPLGPPRQRSLLALLLIHANRVVSTDQIIDELWGDDAGVDRQNALWVHVSNLRSALEPDREKRSAGTVILTRSPGYLLHLAPEDLDSERFVRLLHEGRTLLDSDPAAAASKVAEGLAVWRGRPYEEFSYEPFALARIAELEELRLEAVELRIDADLRRGLAAELVSELDGLVRQHPLREHLSALLMLALYRSGRRAEALRAYRSVRTRLADEVGVDPSAALQALEGQILLGDPALDRGGAAVGAQTRLAVRGYELRDTIGEGRSGLTYRAYQPVVGREVAIKITRADLANEPDFIRRFEADAELVARLEHPHIVPLYDFWREPDAAYFVMRLFRHGSLDRAVGTRPLEPAAAGQIAADLGSALSFAHRHGLVHGNITPANVLLDEERRAYLTDFGVALGLASGAGTLGMDGELRAASFTAPEQRAGQRATPSSDIYSLAAVTAYCLTGRLPMDGRTDLAAAPATVRRALSEAMSPNPAHRPADATELSRAVVAGLGPPARPISSFTMENPYRGLSAFAEADAGNFFGRDRQVERLLSRLGDSGTRGRFVAVVGPSGSGKSSVVSAGVVPALRREAVAGSAQWFIVAMTPGTHPFEELEAALLGVAASTPAGLLDELTDGDAGIGRAIRRVLPDPRASLLLVIDQFEELFTQTLEPTALAFLDGLAAAATDRRGHLRVIVTLRADFYDRPLDHRVVGELLRRGTEAVTPMTADELEQAIVGPAERVGVRFEPGLVAEIVADVVGRSGGLPLLQYALTELFDRRRGRAIERATYREIGGVSGALVRRADGLYDALEPQSRAMARQVFLRLTTLGDGAELVRRRVLLGELAALDGPTVDLVLETFGQHRLLSFDRDPVTRGPTVEIAHEALLSEWARLRRWIEDGREDVLQQRRLAVEAAEWEAASRDAAYLLRGSQLETVVVWAAATDLTLNAAEQAFIDASVAGQEEERSVEEQRRGAENRLRHKARQRTRMLVGGGVVLALVAAVAAFAVVQRNESGRVAKELAATDEARRLSSASTNVADDDPQLAMLLALHAMETSRAAGIRALTEAQDALHWAIQGARLTYPVADASAEVRLGPNGSVGIFQLPLPALVGLARENLTRTLTADECERHLIEPCASDGGGLASPASAGPRATPAEPLATAAPTSALPLAGTTVTVIGQLGLNTGLGNELERFEELTGIRVDYRIEADTGQETPRALTPDIAIRAQPGAIRDLAMSGQLVEIGTYVDPATSRADFGDYVVDAVSTDAGMFGIPLRVDLKGLIWYPEPEFREAGYAVPTTWNELVALTRQMVADGRDPWCIGFEDGDFSGWPGTDWMEALVLQLGGVETYDRWVAHEIPFTDPVVRRAGVLFGEIAFGDGFVRDGASSISRRNVFNVSTPMFSDEPGCWLHHQGNFLTEFLPPGIQAGVDVGFFPMPPVEPGGPSPSFGGGTFAIAFTDRPEVREFMHRVASPDWGAAWSEFTNNGFLPANERFDPERCRQEGVDPRVGEMTVRLCRASRDAVAAGLWRFDASDYMHPAVGSDAFLQGMLDYVDEGPDSLDRILAEIEAAWP